MLVVHRSQRADRLLEGLADVLAVPLPDPMATEVVAVPTRGVERWLSQRLSQILGAPSPDTGGVCANVAFPFPGTLVGEVVATACGVSPETDPWHPRRCVWHLLDVIDESEDDRLLAPLFAHLRAATAPDIEGRTFGLRRFEAARHLADLFDHYAVHRPQLLIDWAAEDVRGGIANDRGGTDPVATWQAHLWRLLRRRLALPSPAERMVESSQRLRAEPSQVDLPQRVSVFGLTRLPASHLQVLQALGEARAVHLFLLHPSPQLWDSVAAEPGISARSLSRTQDPTARLPINPLLRSWGRDAREMQVVLAAGGMDTSVEHPLVEADGSRTSLLRLVQQDIRANRRPPGSPALGGRELRPLLTAGDTSLQLHSCHGRSRQVEVARDAVLHLLADDPSLEPRDVIIMCPDIEGFAPLLHGAFGSDPQRAEDATGLPRVRVRIADRSLRRTNPLLAVAAELIALAGSRSTASEVLDLASRPAISDRFGFDPDELSTLSSWVAAAGVKWGLDTADRQRWRLGALKDHTWAAGLDRLLLGAALASPEAEFAGVAPLGDVNPDEVDLAGRLAEFVERLGRSLARLRTPQPLQDWIRAITEGTQMLASVPAQDSWQMAEFDAVLADVEADEAPAWASTRRRVMSLAEVRSLLDSRLAERPTRANFRTGDLTVCTLVPMRSVPHRAVVLLGLDDGAFPRSDALDGDDLLLADPHVGDRDLRSEDRQLLLDALLSAVDHLVIIFSGRDERTNRRIAPAVPVAELLDVVDATVRGRAGSLARSDILVEHPLQAWDGRNFVPGGLHRSEPWSYDATSAAGAASAASDRQRHRARRWLETPLPPLEEEVVGLEDIINFLRHPVRAFLLRRFGLRLYYPSTGVDDSIPIELDALARWEVGERILSSLLAGSDLSKACAVERARGLIPEGPLGAEILSEVGRAAASLAAAAERLVAGRGSATTLDVDLELDGGKRLLGTLSGLRGDRIMSVSYSRLAPRQRLASWVRFLALSATRPDVEVDAVCVARGRDADHPSVARCGSVAGEPEARRERATEMLGTIVDLYSEGMRAPLPIACRSSAAWAAACRDGAAEGQAIQAAAREWIGSWSTTGGGTGEGADPEHVSVWGQIRFERLLEEMAGPGESRCASAPHASRFGALACGLWSPLLDHEKLSVAR